MAAWLAPIPLLLAAFDASRREARLLAWLAAAIGLSSNFTYYLKTTGTVATVVLLLQVLVWGFLAVRTRAAVLASRNWLVVFVYPVLLAAILMLSVGWLATLVLAFEPQRGELSQPGQRPGSRGQTHSRLQALKGRNR